MRYLISRVLILILAVAPSVNLSAFQSGGWEGPDDNNKFAGAGAGTLGAPESSIWNKSITLLYPIYNNGAAELYVQLVDQNGQIDSNWSTKSKGKLISSSEVAPDDTIKVNSRAYMFSQFSTFGTGAPSFGALFLHYAVSGSYSIVNRVIKGDGSSTLDVELTGSTGRKPTNISYPGFIIVSTGYMVVYSTGDLNGNIDNGGTIEAAVKSGPFLSEKVILLSPVGTLFRPVVSSTNGSLDDNIIIYYGYASQGDPWSLSAASVDSSGDANWNLVLIADKNCADPLSEDTALLRTTSIKMQGQPSNTNLFVVAYEDLNGDIYLSTRFSSDGAHADQANGDLKIAPSFNGGQDLEAIYIYDTDNSDDSFSVITFFLFDGGLYIQRTNVVISGALGNIVSNQWGEPVIVATGSVTEARMSGSDPVVFYLDGDIVRAQKFNPLNGSLLWGGSGTLVSNVNSPKYGLSAVEVNELGATNYVSCWVDSRKSTDKQIYGSKILSDGTHAGSATGSGGGDSGENGGGSGSGVPEDGGDSSGSGSSNAPSTGGNPATGSADITAMCYMATSASLNAHSGLVTELTGFRDSILINNVPGSGAVSLYESLSPAAASTFLYENIATIGFLRLLFTGVVLLFIVLRRAVHIP